MASAASAMAEFWHYFALTLPVALAVWALIEWWQRRRRAPSVRREPTFDEPTFDEPTFEESTFEESTFEESMFEESMIDAPGFGASTPDEPGLTPTAGCPHPHFKRVYVLRDGVSVATDEMQCVQCRQRMRA